MAEKLVIQFEGDMKELRAELKRVLGDVDDTGKKGGKGFGKGFSQGFKDAFAGFTAASMATKGVDLAISKASEALDNMLKKESALAEFSSITGVTGSALQEFGARATELSNTFGGSVVDNIEAFKGVLSALGPGFADSGAAVQKMGENINILAEASGLDATKSMDALTTSMLQFGVDLRDPLAAANEAAVMMNIMAAGAKEGAAEIPEVAEALKQTGLTAKSLNVSFLETNALLQSLATGGKKGSEAGIALRNVLTSMVSVTGPGAESLAKMNLSVDDLGKTLTTRGANEALKQLKVALEKLPGPVERNAALVNLFGKENLAAAQALLAATDGTDKLKKATDGTNVALQQAATNMDTTEARWKRFSTFLDNTLVGALEVSKSRIADVFAGITGIFEGQNIQDAMQDIFSPDVARAKKFMRQQEQDKKEKDAREQKRKDDEAEARKLEEEKNRLFGGEEATERKHNKTLGELRKERDALIESKEGMSDQAAARKLDPRIDALNKQIEAFGGKKKSGGAKKKESPLAGTIGAMEEDLKKLDDLLENKLTPGSEAFLVASRKAIELRKQIDETTAAMKLGVTVEIYRMGEAAKKNQPYLDAMRDRLRDIAIFRIPTIVVPPPPFDATLTGLEAVQVAAEAAGLSVQTLGNIMGTAISGGGDGMKQALKQVGSLAITFAEGMIMVSEGVSLAQAIMSGGLTLLKDAPLLALAGIALEGARAYINSLDAGGVLRSDQMIMAHADETIIPFDKAPEFFAEAVNAGAGGQRVSYRPPYTPPTTTRTQGRVTIDYADAGRGQRNLQLRESRRVG